MVIKIDEFVDKTLEGERKTEEKVIKVVDNFILENKDVREDILDEKEVYVSFKENISLKIGNRVLRKYEKENPNYKIRIAPIKIGDRINYEGLYFKRK